MKKIISILLVILMTFSLFNKVAFADTITKEDLEKAIENFLANDEKQSTTINVDDKYINITMTDNDKDSETYGETNNYQIEYDLSDNPTYKIEANIKKGMTYDDYENEIGKSYILCIAYILTLNCLEVSVKDSATYFLFSLLGDALGSVDEDVLANQKYLIVDDDSEPTVSGDSEVIKKSEFGNKAIDYFNETYKDSTISDSEVNSYQLTSVRSDIDSENIKVTSTLTVNTSADLSKIKGFKDSLESGFKEMDTSDVLNSLNGNNDNNEASNDNNEENNSENNNNLDGNKVLGSTNNPETGINSYVYIGIGCILLTIIVLIVNNKIHKKSTI